MDGSQENEDLGPWTGDDLLSTARSGATVGADAGLPDSVRFLAGVAKLIRRRIAETREPEAVKPAIFLLEPNPLSLNLAVTLKRIPMLYNGLEPINGRMWFVNAAVSTGKYIDLGDRDDNEIFEAVTDEFRLGGVPAIFYETRTSVPTIRFYPNGLGDDDTHHPVAISNADVSLNRIFETIDQVYRTCMVTPEAQANAGKLWTANEKWWTARNAEDLVQLHLRVGLTVAFPSCNVRAEQTQVSGRLDLEIEEPDILDSTSVTRHAILELKVLRSFGSTGNAYSEEGTLQWVEDGVKQAAAYRNDRSARKAALCCFDMRSEDTKNACFSHVTALATRLEVELRRWFLYATSKLYRDAVTSAMPS